MKPKNKFQKILIENSKELGDIKKEHKDWIKNIIPKFYTKAYTSNYCLECNHKWKEDNPKSCPKCNTKFKYTSLNNLVKYDYIWIFDTINKMQVIRLIYVSKVMSRRNKPRYHIREVFQHWIDENGKYDILSLATAGMSRYYDQWLFGTELSPKSDTRGLDMRKDLTAMAIYPKRKILPIIKRNGFKTAFHKIQPYKLFIALLTNNKLETLYKAKQYKLFKYGLDKFNNIERFWGSIKIAIRNGYVIDNPSDWIDYLGYLSDFGKDLKNVKYVCPIDLDKEHDKYIQKQAKIDAKKKYLELKEEIENDNKQYLKDKKRLLDIVIKDSNIEIKPLQSVKEFLQIGEQLNHCVFQREYYKDKNSLILSAKVDGVEMETIEIGLNNMKILQIRGMNNKPSKYNKQVKRLVENNINLIQKVYAKL